MVDMEEAPLAFLKLSTITQLAGQLNSKKIIPTDDGLLRFSYIKYQGYMKSPPPLDNIQG